MKKCKRCKGLGQIPNDNKKYQLIGYAFITCPSCHGKGGK